MGIDPRLLDALREMSSADREALGKWLHDADERDPRVTPVYLDKFLASAGGASGLYRTFRRACDDGVVFVEESRSPFDPAGKVVSLDRKTWERWVQRSEVVARAGCQRTLPGVPNVWWTHYEILQGCAAVMHNKDVFAALSLPRN